MRTPKALPRKADSSWRQKPVSARVTARVALRSISSGSGAPLMSTVSRSSTANTSRSASIVSPAICRRGSSIRSTTVAGTRICSFTMSSPLVASVACGLVASGTPMPGLPIAIVEPVDLVLLRRHEVGQGAAAPLRLAGVEVDVGGAPRQRIGAALQLQRPAVGSRSAPASGRRRRCRPPSGSARRPPPGVAPGRRERGTRRRRARPPARTRASGGARRSGTTARRGRTARRCRRRSRRWRPAGSSAPAPVGRRRCRRGCSGARRSARRRSGRRR